LICCRLLQVEHKSIPEIARELSHLQQLAAAGRLSSKDVSHGSLTISNIGGWPPVQSSATVAALKATAAVLICGLHPRLLQPKTEL
jgi:pyruvate/2-oxoglutarate dehydrogenase complex dihydrolipoamide acyltransferase (E2) component